ncbi:MAG: DUF3857 domain-containing protein [Nitrosopumilaceae archaeon]|nr:DUF3857 and transglutaminase domain-containing protein [Nitrosopumilaceae archaeon]NIX62223.1 DUF3857 domain-containing protein [Nitrosopumilaceae archaeon]
MQNVNSFYRFIQVIVPFLFLSGFLMAQKFGKVSAEELKMSTLQEAPEADVVYLFDKGEMEIVLENNKYYRRLKEHVRIKILTKEGKENPNITNVRIPYWSENDVRDIEANTFLPDGDKIELDNDDIFEEEDEDWKYKVFAFPGVEVGAVLEYTYERGSRYLHFLEPWYFQNQEFTKLSQFSVTIMPGFQYNVFFKNTVNIEPEVEEILTHTRKTLKKYTWKMENLPPIKKEPYMRTLEDYRAALHFQLMTYRDRYQYVEFITTWSELVEKQRKRFKEYLEEDNSLRDLVQEKLADSLTSLEKMKALYDFVRKEIRSSERGNIYVDKEPEDVIEDLSGTGAEKNLLLINLLRTAGFTAHPLLISTRKHGRVNTNIPQLLQFNYVLAHVKIAKKTYVLDTYDKYCPYNMLPVYNLIETGLLINDVEGKFIEIPHPRHTNMFYLDTEATLNEDGELAAKSIFRFEGYRALKGRGEIRDSDEEAFVRERLTERFETVEIDSVSIKGLDQIEQPLFAVVHYKVPEYAQIVGNMVYLDTPLLSCLESNPFKREKRYFPVEFPFNEANTEKISLKLPTGMHIEELPKSKLYRHRGISFMISCKSEDNTVSVERHYIRRKLTYTPREYTKLRSFFDRMIDADQGQIVLANVTEQSESAQSGLTQ